MIKADSVYVVEVSTFAKVLEQLGYCWLKIGLFTLSILLNCYS